MEASGQRNQKQSFHYVFGQDSKALGSHQVPNIWDRWGGSFPGKLGPLLYCLSGGAAWVFKASFSANDSLLSFKCLINKSRSYCIYSPKLYLCSGFTKNPQITGNDKNGQFWHYEWCSVVQSFLTVCHPMDCSLPGSSVHRIFWARTMEWVAISSYRGSSWPRDRTCASCISCIGRQILYHWATQETLWMMLSISKKKKRSWEQTFLHVSTHQRQQNYCHVMPS